MFVPDPAAAMREIARVLRPGGRAMLSVWASQNYNPWLGLLFQAVSEGTGRPMPPPGLPTVFSLGSSERFTAIVSSALADVTVQELPLPLQANSFAEYWTRTTALAGPVSKILAQLPPPVLDQIGDDSRSS